MPTLSLSNNDSTSNSTNVAWVIIQLLLTLLVPFLFMFMIACVAHRNLMLARANAQRHQGVNHSIASQEEL
jgi:hypothetical protein